MIRQQIIAVVLFLSLGFSSFAEESPAVADITKVDQADAAGEASGKDITYLICKNKSVVRTVRVQKKENGGCRTTYTKDGVDQKVADSWAVPRCSKILGNIKINLEKANWKCKDISEARVSSTEE